MDWRGRGLNHRPSGWWATALPVPQVEHKRPNRNHFFSRKWSQLKSYKFCRYLLKQVEQQALQITEYLTGPCPPEWHKAFSDMTCNNRTKKKKSWSYNSMVQVYQGLGTNMTFVLREGLWFRVKCLLPYFLNIVKVRDYCSSWLQEANIDLRMETNKHLSCLLTFGRTIHPPQPPPSCRLWLNRIVIWHLPLLLLDKSHNSSSP